ncbi:restriction endonuclease subunit R [Microcoleus sp. FACHB-1515]|uniref:restriction endonuclease subunit R n=1 Tax=Cyanophyceae TaxID=3028117 RepID=UPI001683EEAE|nr:restriction endonuclease subunit R [Microcoleus sp. FACHB-1515]MBD2089303.1 restriction endonuclease subunit R [Microcoleus sp. FACHB-1515]
MSTTLNARNLTLADVHRLLNFQMQTDGKLTSELSLEPLTEAEQQELICIRDDFQPYIAAGKMSEGIVKALTVFPLLRLAGFYRSPIQLSIEEGIDAICIDTEDTKVTGRMDILAINHVERTSPLFWILVIEAKEGLSNVWAGLPQLLTYTYKSLDHQSSVWGLATNGLNYQFVQVQAGNPAIYRLMPLLNLIESDHLLQLLQVLKAIHNLNFSTGDS